jgi:aldehyde dehydrogenase (NAD+)
MGPKTTTMLDELATRNESCFIDGVWQDGALDQVIPMIDPMTELVVAELTSASVAQTESAVHAARRAFDDGAWPRLDPMVRSVVLHKLADRFEAEADRFATLLVTEIGSPIALARGGQVDNALELLRWFADAAATGPRPGFEEILSTHRSPVASRSVLRQEPVGVVAGLTAFNFPLLLLIRKLGGALAAGCTIVVMPSPRAPLSTIAFMKLVEESDLPPGTVNLVIGGPDVGKALSSSPEVDMLTFTGSRAVGQAIMEQAAKGIKKVVLELGGKSANIVLPGADVAATVRPSLLRYSLNAGQACGATTRTFVMQADYDEYVETSRGIFSEMVVGDPRDRATVVGPLIRAEQRSFVEGYINRALGEGAKIEAGVSSFPQSGYFVAPQLIGGVTNESEISREELFGPVGVIIPVNSVDEAVTLANASSFGLNASVWGPTSAALDVARRLRTGSVAINGGGGGRQDAPWGGFKESGVGREGGEAGFREFFEVKHIQWRI